MDGAHCHDILIFYSKSDEICNNVDGEHFYHFLSRALSMYYDPIKPRKLILKNLEHLPNYDGYLHLTAIYSDCV